MSTTYRAFTAGTEGGVYRRGVEDVVQEPLPDNTVRIRVDYSSVNYKDHLASTENGKVARIDPIIPGIDLAGTVVESTSPEHEVGKTVIAHGYELGVARNGGFAEFAVVPADWIVRLPYQMSAQEAMILGTAGFTAGLSVQAIVKGGIEPKHGPVLVTGATGGVGSVATVMLAELGYEVIASTGRTEHTAWLTKLGAREVRDRMPVDAKPLGKESWAAAVDSVGGTTLHAALASTKYGGVVAACGNTGGFKLETTVFPFILRGVSLVGIDSVACPLTVRQQTWDRIAEIVPKSHYELLRGDVVDLEGVEDALGKIAGGTAEGRTLVRPGNPAQ
ncbi:acryloyl-CoA reductase [Rhodococcus pyridinivorans]|uniref:acrylyl-CoA reductase family protein n=1 Tax=Rhodococcus pyridinivorans TaxID=103816 RepID=UPI001E4898A9|nr:acryloyl-CoA reductase [Rhodococcus pyridinivorans]MCD5422852.1 acryloyl-CoA reductase [Rhodococcus pyridinivorans]